MLNSHPSDLAKISIPLLDHFVHFFEWNISYAKICRIGGFIIFENKPANIVFPIVF